MKTILFILFLLSLQTASAQKSQEDSLMQAVRNANGCQWRQTKNGGSVYKCFDEKNNLISMDIVRVKRNVSKNNHRFYRKTKEYNKEGNLVYHSRSKPWGHGGARNIIIKCTYYESGTLKQIIKTKEHRACKGGYVDYCRTKNFDSDGRKIKEDE